MNLATTHWAEPFIGKPYVDGGEGPDSFDCWGLVREIVRIRHAIDLPAHAIDVRNIAAVTRAIATHPVRACFALIDAPIDGALGVLGRARYGSHIGMWCAVDGGRLLHTVKGSGVVASDLMTLRLYGWSKIEWFYPRIEPANES